ncbi:hypothetical protein V518_2600 [Thermoanaerobacterium aotearoense SCUT27]|uniref:Uncharacterized protein n=2 Tax=Thermoanaerobacterium TaxID=28895 RepID=W9E7F3_9THEO|nr:hypothetical protein Tsac_1111 [Thermoanaerobacterium saccharolyticum JW/SL-YS485]ETO37287.1 hypothetical protein V518_2600 [Thermoanaerobacterium aotearoense SCUT27]
MEEIGRIGLRLEGIRIFGVLDWSGVYFKYT